MRDDEVKLRRYYYWFGYGSGWFMGMANAASVSMWAQGNRVLAVGFVLVGAVPLICAGMTRYGGELGRSLLRSQKFWETDRGKRINRAIQIALIPLVGLVLLGLLSR